MTFSHISGITLLAVPADVYMYGASYWWSMVSMTITGSATAFIYLPVFFRLQLTSSYEYFKLRFDSSLRVISSLLFALTMLLYLPIVIYIPALAFSQGKYIPIEYVNASTQMLDELHNQHKNFSDWSKYSHDHPSRVCCLHILYNNRRVKGCCVDGYTAIFSYGGSHDCRPVFGD